MLERENLSRFERVNHWYWEDLSRLHTSACLKLTQAVENGACTLRHLELEAAGDVKDKCLLHLMCHLGHDSVSWSRHGAHVTAADASPTAIDAARLLARRCVQPVQFELLRIPHLLPQWNDRFDIVVLTYGVLEWLPDLAESFSAFAKCLAQGGRLIIIDDHPDFDADPRSHHQVPRCHLTQGSYLNRAAHVLTPIHYRWKHSMAEILSAVNDSHLRLDWLEEYGFAHYARIATLRLAEDGYFYPPERDGKLLLLQLVAHKDVR